MINLLKETIMFLAKIGKTLEDVLWIGGNDFTISKEDFIRLADVRYDKGYGSTYVPRDLKLVGTDWWIQRWEYDGSEGWKYMTFPTKPISEIKISKLVATDNDEGCGSKDYYNTYSMKQLDDYTRKEIKKTVDRTVARHYRRHPELVKEFDEE